jgi:uncharacterized RDD family membrane protein YckC
MNIKGILLCLLFVTLVPFAFADEVHLKTGQIVIGTIIDRNDQYVTLKTGGAPVYLAMDQIEKIIEGDVPLLTEQAPQPQTVSRIQPVNQAATGYQGLTTQPKENKLIDGKDGDYYYQKSKKDLQTGNLKESMRNLYLAVSLGAVDSDGLKDQITRAMKLVETVESKKSELKKLTDQVDPGMLRIILRIGLIIVALMFVVFIFKFFTREKSVSTASPLFKPKNRNLLMQEALEGNFVKAGPNKRICAFLIDTILIFIIPNVIVFNLAGQLYSSLLWLVYLLLKDCFGGQSLGKRIVRIRIVDKNLQPAGPDQTVMRNFYWVLVCVFPLFHRYLIFLSLLIIVLEFITMQRDFNGQRFGDKLSSTRVMDLKPLTADWKFIFLTLIVIVFGGVLYTASTNLLLRLLNRSENALNTEEFKDPSGRFAFKVPLSFKADEEYTKDNLFVFKRTDDKQLFSVLIADNGQPMELSPQELANFAASFLALKLKVDVKDILANTSISQTTVSGKQAALFIYQSDSGKNVSVCLLNGQLFYEIGFHFKEGEIDQGLLNEFLMDFRFLE